MRPQKPTIAFITLLLLSVPLASSIDLVTRSYKIDTAAAAITQANTVEIKSVCFADCRSCQMTTGDCE